MGNEPLLVTIKDAMRLLSCSRSSVNRLVRAGYLAKVSVNDTRFKRITMESINSLIKSQGSSQTHTHISYDVATDTDKQKR